jgi:hypothetical protein
VPSLLVPVGHRAANPTDVTLGPAFPAESSEEGGTWRMRRVSARRRCDATWAARTRRASPASWDARSGGCSSGRRVTTPVSPSGSPPGIGARTGRLRPPRRRWSPSCWPPATAWRPTPGPSGARRPSPGSFCRWGSPRQSSRSRGRSSGSSAGRAAPSLAAGSGAATSPRAPPTQARGCRGAGGAAPGRSPRSPVPGRRSGGPFAQRHGRGQPPGCA